MLPPITSTSPTRRSTVRRRPMPALRCRRRSSSTAVWRMPARWSCRSAAACASKDRRGEEAFFLPAPSFPRRRESRRACRCRSRDVKGFWTPAFARLPRKRRTMPLARRTPAKAGVQLARCFSSLQTSPTWAPAFAGVQEGEFCRGFAFTGMTT
ncbi:hypothetical protein SPHINGO8AM_30303 [Sphingomonas sp. 8AM]|nr:hypothetical protein SPHINGO8AM_30303 [Sphingomonas sp. 8AM]